MEIKALYDVESSKISEKMIFSCEYYELTYDDIVQLKKKKLIEYIQEDDLPRNIPCQILICIEHINKARIIFYNPRFVVPQQVFDNAFLNKDIIDRCQKNGGFWMECTLPLYDKHIKLDFSFKIGE